MVTVKYIFSVSELMFNTLNIALLISVWKIPVDDVNFRDYVMDMLETMRSQYN